jgi:hypothetical protein
VQELLGAWLYFWVGVLGRFSWELLMLLRFLDRNAYRLDFAHRQPAYYLGRFVLMLIGGVLADLFSFGSTEVAFAIGVSTPLVVEQFSRRPPNIPS